MIRRTRRQRTDAGSTLLEMALAIGTILLIMFLIIDVGRALYAYNWISRAARQATRFAIVRGVHCDPKLASYCSLNPKGARNTDITAYVQSFATGINTDPTVLTVTSKCYVSGAAGTNDPPCGASDNGTIRPWIRVTVTYHFQFLSPIFPTLAWDMHSSSERIMEN